MKIVDIRTRRRSLYALVLDDGFEQDGAKFDDNGYLLIDRGAFDESGLSVGSVLDDDRLAELVRCSAYYRARSRALYYLSSRSFAEKEMADKLKREFGAEAATAAAKRMTELGLIDDGEYAERCAEIMLNVKAWSPSRAVRELTLKGVDRDIAEQAVGRVGCDPCEMIAKLIEKKYAAQLETRDPKAINRVANALARKGYSFSDIHSVIGRYYDDRFYD